MLTNEYEEIDKSIINIDLDKKDALIDNTFNSFTYKEKADYFKYFDDLVSLYKKVQHILLVSLNDVFLDNNLSILAKDKLILDTIEIIKQNNYDLNKILCIDMQLSKTYPQNNLIYDNDIDKLIVANLFTCYSRICDELLSSNLIERPDTSSNSTKIDNKEKQSKFKSKKNYEVELLSQYMLEIIDKEKIKNLIEMGCGKSYLTDSIMLTDDMVYIGLDRKDDLIEKSTKSNKKNNIHVLNHDITIKNFNPIFNSEIDQKLNKDGNKDNKIMLFGLHSCGNLTSDTLKIFFENESFSHIVIVGCCLNLLKEYISEDVNKSSDLFRRYINSIGYDSKGNFLEQTLLYEYDYEQVGFPLSNYTRNNKNEHKDFFLTRTVRNASMQSFPKNEERYISMKNNLFYRKILYRTILQAFFEKYFNELKNYYGYGKIDLKIEDGFNEYLNIVIKNLKKIMKSGGNKQYNCNNMIKKLNNMEEVLMGIDSKSLYEFVTLYEEMQDVLWAVYVIRLKFAKIIEYIIALDRVMFMLEKGTSNIHLVKIFDESVSVRNILIYATK